MPGGLRVDLYCLCWNDAQMMPYFFRHYDDLVDRYFVFDDGSTDNSLELLKAHGRVHLERLDDHGESFVDAERRLSDEIRKRSRDEADWVIVAHIDEHLYRPDLIGYLTRCRAEGITAIRSIGYQMVADEFPVASDRLTNLVTRGCRWNDHDKLCLFNPNAIIAARFGPGRLRAWPEGHVVWPPTREILMLHYGQLGIEYVAARSAELAKHPGRTDLTKARGLSDALSRDQIAAYLESLKNESQQPVPGLGVLSLMKPEHYRADEHAVEESGLLDVDWYLATYLDVRDTNTDPLVHFCQVGWKENRLPNFYFDPLWYLSTYPEAASGELNPLIDYIRSGESAGRYPSVHFDPDWYRRRYELTSDESPLEHYLRRRYSGKFSPLPDFDVGTYCEEHPEVLLESRDPYLDFVEHNRQAEELESRHETPTIAEVATAAGFDTEAGVIPANLPWDSVQQIVRLFLRAVPVDETWYRLTYEDVDEAIRAGHVLSARAHFIKHGYFEGRLPGADRHADQASKFERV